jgi:glycosyltransferase involved in cell wall biosynthesis
MGGGSIINPQLIKNPGFNISLKSNIHKLLNASVKLNPFYYYYFHKCDKIILRTKETLDIIPNRFLYKCSVHLETGLDEFKNMKPEKTRILKKVITTGRIIKSKNIDQVIDVFKELSRLYHEPISLHILGGGPLLENYKKQFSNETNIFFEGRVPHEKVNSFLKSADLFLFCSIKEGGSHSLFEAAKYNLPIACYNISGMQEFPRNNSSIKIRPIKDIESNTKKLANKILEAFNHPMQVDKCCENAIEDIQQNYFWKNHAQRYIKIYNEIK